MNFPRQARFTFWASALAAWLFLWPPGMVNAVQQFSSRVWQTDDGLPQNSVQAIAQTSDGFLWVGTQKGLARFDGVNFTVFNGQNVPQLKNDWIECLCAVRDGSLWIGVRDGGACRLKDGVFTHFEIDSGTARRVLAIYESKDGSLWFGLRNGLRRWEGETFVKVFSDTFTDECGIRSICEDAEGNFWFASAIGLFCLPEGKMSDGLVRVRNDQFLRTVFSDRSGRIWVGTSKNGLRELNRQAPMHFTKEDGLADNSVSSIYEDCDGTLWVGTFGGLSRLVDGKIVTERDESGNYFDLVSSFCEDHEGNLWVGAKDGLYRLNPRQFNAYTTRHGLAHNNVISVMEDREGTVWFGTWGGGLHQLWDDEVVSMQITNKTGFANDLILALAQGKDGAIWIGGDYNSGVYRFRDGEFKRYWSRAHSLDGHAVRVIHEDRGDRLWIGTGTIGASGALNLLTNEKFIQYTAREGLSGDIVKAICEDRAGDLWIGTDGGLTRRREGNFYTFTEKDGFGKKTVASIYEDGEGALWIGTIGHGLHRYMDGKFRTFTTKDGLFDDTAHEIIEDDFEHLWMSCRNGVYRVSKKNLADYAEGRIRHLSCVSYGRADGLLTTECNGVAKPSACKTRDGRIWFATTKGLVVTDPKTELRKNEIAPAVVISEVIADEKRVKYAGFPRAHSPAHPLTIPAGRGELEFHYAALSFRTPSKNRFKYRLEGFDQNWVDAGARRVAYYNNLPPGNYQFHVIGSNNDGVWNEIGSSIKLTLSPHFWQTWWFQGGGMVCLVAGAALAYRWRQNRLREIEKLRVRIAADLHDEIGANLASIALLSQMSAPESEKSELSEINRIALNTAGSIREIVWFINPDYDTFAEMTSRMRDVAATMLTGFKCEFKSAPKPGGQVLALELRRNIFFVFKEILHNIVKHSQAAKVEIEIVESDGHLHLRIADDGVGFEEQAIRQGNGLKNIRLRLAQLKGKVGIRSHPGQGTIICVSVKLT